MSAIAINKYSGELTKSTVALNGGVLTELIPSEFAGRLRTARFTYTPAAAVAAGQVIALVALPKGARIIAGKIASNGIIATGTGSVGIIAADGSGVIDSSSTADSATFFSGSLTLATAGEYVFANTIALHYGYVTQVPVFISVTLGTAGFAGTGDSIQGHVTYITD